MPTSIDSMQNFGILTDSMEICRRIFLCACLVVAFLLALPCSASVGFLLEEPFGTFGALNPTGHGALYFDHLCAASPTRLRPCMPGELGVVISRYHRVDGYDWLAIPLVPYLYGVETIDEVPSEVDAATVQQIRDTYRRRHLERIAPTRLDGSSPGGEWIQLVGSSFDRRIYSFELETTPEQEQMVMEQLNDSRNKAHFNLFFHNCADFSRKVLNRMYPGAVHRNVIADFALTTPKQVARSFRSYALHNPELVYNEYIIPQVPGQLPRSHRVDGISESLVRSKKYIVPLVFVAPWTTGSIVAAYVSTGRFTPRISSAVLPEIDRRERNRVQLESSELYLPGIEPSTSKAVQGSMKMSTSSEAVEPAESSGALLSAVAADRLDAGAIAGN